MSEPVLWGVVLHVGFVVSEASIWPFYVPLYRMLATYLKQELRSQLV